MRVNGVESVGNMMREEGLEIVDSECELIREVFNFGNWIDVNVIN